LDAKALLISGGGPIEEGGIQERCRGEKASLVLKKMRQRSPKKEDTGTFAARPTPRDRKAKGKRKKKSLKRKENNKAKEGSKKKRSG